MSTTEHKRLIQRLFNEGFNDGKLAVVDELFHPDFVDRSTPDQLPGREGVKDYISMVRTGFPDIFITIEDLIAEGDKVVVRTTWRGTHQGEYEGMKPTGKCITRTMIQIFRIVNGRLYEEWVEGEGLEELVIK
jgi:predicted ester cyclase